MHFADDTADRATKRHHKSDAVTDAVSVLQVRVHHRILVSSACVVQVVHVFHQDVAFVLHKNAHVLPNYSLSRPQYIAKSLSGKSGTHFVVDCVGRQKQKNTLKILQYVPDSFATLGVHRSYRPTPCQWDFYFIVFSSK